MRSALNGPFGSSATIIFGSAATGRANDRAALGSAVAMRARRAPRDCGDPRDAKCLGSRATVRPRVLTRNRLGESAHRATLDRSRDALSP